MAEQVSASEDAGRLIAGRYTVEEVLGRGGMAKVYRVRDARTGRKLALKRTWARDSKRSEKRRALLEREYHTLAQLAHPRIIEVYDYGLAEDGPYYTMELLDGADLDKGGRLPWEQVCALLRDVASSLAILHARGLIHRDVSLRNVRCTADGRAKLIDFGAMASMGVAKDVVGTPPFMAPEVLQLQALDARADLFSLGALGYYLLTGRHAYPARRLSELRDVWRSRPAAPSRLVPEVPPSLNALISELLLLDRNSRPHSAAEVMERLCAIAGLPLEERVEVSRAYLATPTLVGRDKALIAVRRRMLSLVRGDGGALLIEGPAGSGRSRLLDASAFEGKLLGVVVVRADAGDGSTGDWGVARAICAQLLELMPRQATDAARLSIDILGHVIDGLRGDSVSLVPPERSLVLRELRDFLLSLTRGQRLLIVVDDADRIDEPSAALLAALAHKTDRHALMLALSMDPESEHTGAALRVLCTVSDRILLEPLTAEETAALMRSVFGDVANLHLCAGRIFALAHGSPRTTMELAQHLVSRGLARYAAGSWSLPAQLDEGDLPSSLSASLAARLSVLSSEARELAYALCLAEADALSLDGYRELTAYDEDRRVFRALDELMAARVLVSEGQRYHISQRGFLAVLQDALPADRREALHSRVADLLAKNGGDVLRRAQHLLLGGRDLEAIELLCSIDLRAQLPPLALLELALERAERHASPARTLHVLRLAVLSKAPLVLAVQSARRCLPPVLAQLEQDSGLVLFRELSHLPPSERLAQAFAGAQRRYQQTPENERVCSPLEALSELGKVLSSCYSLASLSFDLDFFESLPSAEPLVPLWPSLGALGLIGARTREWMVGRRSRGVELTQGLLEHLAAPESAAIDEIQHSRIRLVLLYSLGLFEASMGSGKTEQYAQVLEGDREHRVSAWRVRVLMHLNQGNAEEARKCLRRAELLQLQDGGEQRYLGTSSGLELIAYAQAGDLLGVKSAVDAVAVLAERCEGWQPLLRYGLCYQLWLRGDLKGAIAMLLPAFEIARPGRHPYFSVIAAAHVALLDALGRDDEALSFGESYAETCRREALTPDDRFVYVELAQVLARKGEHRRALDMIDAVIAEGQRMRMAGLSLGLLYEARARIAIYMRDRPLFERSAELCAIEYKKGRNPVLGQKLARLMEEARKNRAAPSEPPPQVKLLLAVTQQHETEHDTINSRILECVDGSDRARCALTMLLQSTESSVGYLYGAWDGRVEMLAALPDVPAEDGLGCWVQECIQVEIDTGGSATLTADADAEVDDSEREVASRYIDQDGRCFQSVLLVAMHQQQLSIAGVLALQIGAAPRSLPKKELLEEIAAVLLEQGDVGGVAMLDAGATLET